MTLILVIAMSYEYYRGLHVIVISFHTVKVMLSCAIVSGILWIILAVSLALLIYYLIKVSKCKFLQKNQSPVSYQANHNLIIKIIAAISSWNYRMFSSFVIIVEIILLLTILIMLIVFGTQQGECIVLHYYGDTIIIMSCIVTL